MAASRRRLQTPASNTGAAGEQEQRRWRQRTAASGAASVCRDGPSAIEGSERPVFYKARWSAISASSLIVSSRSVCAHGARRGARAGRDELSLQSTAEELAAARGGGQGRGGREGCRCHRTHGRRARREGAAREGGGVPALGPRAQPRAERAGRVEGGTPLGIVCVPGRVWGAQDRRWATSLVFLADRTLEITESGRTIWVRNEESCQMRRLGVVRRAGAGGWGRREDAGGRTAASPRHSLNRRSIRSGSTPAWIWPRPWHSRAPSASGGLLVTGGCRATPRRELRPQRVGPPRCKRSTR